MAFNWARRIINNIIKRFIVVSDAVFLSFFKSVSGGGLALIRLDAIGDFVIWLDSAKEYRLLYPDQKIILIANATWADLADTLPYWDEIWPVCLRDLAYNPLYRWSFFYKVRRAGFDIAIQPTHSRSIMHGDSVIRATCARQRIGSEGDLSNISTEDKALSDRWYTCLLQASTEPLMELERNADFLHQLSGQNFKAAIPVLPSRMELPMRLQPDGHYFIIFPGGSWVGRQWPVEKFQLLLRELHAAYGLRAVLCGAKVERALCEQITSGLVKKTDNRAGETSLAEFSELVRGASFLVGNETSAVHIAAAVGTPSVCILGGGYFRRFMPYPNEMPGIKPVAIYEQMDCFDCNWHCTQPHDMNGPVPCVRDVSVAQVLEGVREALAYATDGEQ